MDIATKKEFENLAGMVKRGFDDVQKEVSGLRSETQGEFKIVTTELRHGNARLTIIEQDISDIRKHFVYRDEFEDALGRIAYLEQKLGVKSGK